MTLIERMRRAGLHADVRALFATSTLAELAQAVGGESDAVEVPPNRIPAACEAITPEMLPLVKLRRRGDRAHRRTGAGGRGQHPGHLSAGAAAGGHSLPPPDGARGRPLSVARALRLRQPRAAGRYLEALQAVIDRHDILRTAVLWEGLAEPVQVVWRAARLKVEEVRLDPAEGDIARQLAARFDPRRYRLDVSQAPLLRIFIAEDRANARWVMLLLFHHLVIDHTALEVMQQEVQAHLLGQAEKLPAPLPFRNFVAQARLGVAREEHEAYFQEAARGRGGADRALRAHRRAGRRLGHHRSAAGGGSAACEAAARAGARAGGERGEPVSPRLCAGARAHLGARRRGVRHGALRAHAGGRGRGAGAGALHQYAAGADPRGAEGVEESVRSTHAQLAQLLRHEHASLALAQRCSA